MKLEGDAHVRLRDAWLVRLDLHGTYSNDNTPGQVPGSFTVQRTVREP
jgi:hypothetical protein